MPRSAPAAWLWEAGERRGAIAVRSRFIRASQALGPRGFSGSHSSVGHHQQPSQVGPCRPHGAPPPAQLAGRRGARARGHQGRRELGLRGRTRTSAGRAASQALRPGAGSRAAWKARPSFGRLVIWPADARSTSSISASRRTSARPAPRAVTVTYPAKTLLSTCRPAPQAGGRGAPPGGMLPSAPPAACLIRHGSHARRQPAALPCRSGQRPPTRPAPCDGRAAAHTRGPAPLHQHGQDNACREQHPAPTEEAEPTRAGVQESAALMARACSAPDQRSGCRRQAPDAPWLLPASLPEPGPCARPRRGSICQRWRRSRLAV